ncbi:MAG: helix-turn-helix domain-containing protein [Roseibium sp.]|uniref:helix-turn-helix transcriptional regulator n=1 Tax=Roseibium sp. TaxID=1936156 RepID=UPI003D9C5314
MMNLVEQFDPDRLINEQDAANFLCVSFRTLQAWRVRGGGPKFCKIGRAVRYRRADLLAFATSNSAHSTTEADAKRAERSK